MIIRGNYRTFPPAWFSILGECSLYLKVLVFTPLPADHSEAFPEGKIGLELSNTTIKTHYPNQTKIINSYRQQKHRSLLVDRYVEFTLDEPLYPFSKENRHKHSMIWITYPQVMRMSKSFVSCLTLPHNPLSISRLIRGTWLVRIWLPGQSVKSLDPFGSSTR
jgi:hypothetical protein